MTIDWSWPPTILTPPAIETLTHTWQQTIHALTTHTQHTGAGGLTPSDLSLVSLSQAEIEQLEAGWRAAQ
jgi:pristinamycin I synthase-2